MVGEYPFIEFAYLMTENRKVGNRYPHPVFLKSYKKSGIPMAIHICGKMAHAFIKTGDWTPIYETLGDSMNLFDRIQLNIPKTIHFSRDISFPDGKEIIIQLHPGTEALFDHYCHTPHVYGFQDGSCGRGISCTEWMAPKGDFFGYAGGIGPDNVVECVRAIDEICPSPYWIDMESSIRTNDKFDIGKCRKVCEALVREKLIGHC